MQMNLRWYSGRYRLACVCDALLLPVSLVLWYRQNFSSDAGDTPVGSVHRPGLLISALLMILVWRAVLKIEQAICTPWAYRWDLGRAVRWYVVIVAMGLAVSLLR